MIQKWRLVFVLLFVSACAAEPIMVPPAMSPVSGAGISQSQAMDDTENMQSPAPADRLSEPMHKPVPTSGSLWRSGPQSLFGDRRAQSQGDILTVVIEINDQAEIQNQTDRARSGSETMSIPNLFGLEASADRVLPPNPSLSPAIDTSSSTATSGAGSTSRNEQLTLRVAATVTAVLPNGHLLVEGSQEVRVNFELRDLAVAGVVRPEDINRRNEITYDKIASARIAYGGRGQLTILQQPRWGQQVLERISPF